MRFNFFAKKPRTHEGAPATVLSPAVQLERSLMACLCGRTVFMKVVSALRNA